MPNRSPSKQRLEELIALARTYRGWSNKDLARELGRDVHHLVPESGVPKLDIVIALADALDWTVQDVVDDLCGNVPASAKEKPAETWAELDRAAFEAFNEGRFEDVVGIASRERAAAENGDQRAIACNRLAMAWESLGSYLNAAEAAQQGLSEANAGSEIVLHLRNNLALAHLYLSRTVEAEGVAGSTLELVGRGILRSRFVDSATGFAHYVRASARCAIAAAGGDQSAPIARAALMDLEVAMPLFQRAWERDAVPAHQAMLRLCDGLRIELEALVGIIPASDAIACVLQGLEDVTDPAALPRDSRLEAYGWWCIFGANITIRAQLSDQDRAQLMGVFTNKADEIAERLGNWALRERVWALELARRAHADRTVVGDWTVDQDDVRQISGAMARFPSFRTLGWEVLRSVQVRDLERGAP